MDALWIPDQSFHQKPLVALFQEALRLHRLMEEDFSDRLRQTGSSNMDFMFPHMNLPLQDYFQRNFFSILFLSIFKQLKIEDNRIILYGIILHCVRGLVTASDNILDEEDKGAVKININIGNVLPNIFLILLQQGVLIETLNEVVSERTTGKKVFRSLMASLFDIAAEESHEEGNVETVLSPEDLIQQIHRLRGGRLLELAFIVPEIVEKSMTQEMRVARNDIHQIGVALQMMDDITDLHIDVKSRNHNVLRSWIIHKAPDGTMTDQQLLAMPDEVLAEPAVIFPKATQQVLEQLIETALQGFTDLGKIGYPIDGHDALMLIQILFHIRGLSHLWQLADLQS